MHIFSKLLLKTATVTVAFLLIFSAANATNDVFIKNVNIAVASAPITLDPRYATDAASVRLLNLIAPPLAKYDDQSRLVPMVASSINHDNFQIFTVRLKDKTFHNGEKLTAKHVKEFYDSILNSKNASPLKGTLKDLVSVSAMNGNKVVFQLDKPNPWFFSAFEIPIIKIATDAAEKPVGLGEYKLQSIDDYGNVSLINNKQKLNFRVIKDPVVRVLKIIKGDVDIIHNDLPIELYKHGLAKGLQGITSPSASYTYIGFNMSSGNSSKLSVRKALGYAINREEIQKYLLGGETKPANSLLLPTHKAFYEANGLSYNLIKAVELLEKAGFKADENGKRLVLKMAVTTNPFVLRLAQAIQQDLLKVGIDLQISSSEWGSFYSNIKKGNFESYILTWVGNFQPDFYYNVFHSSQMPPVGANRGRYSSKEMDYLLDNLMLSTNARQQSVLAKEVQKIQENDVIYLPLWRRNHMALINEKFKDYQMPVDGGYGYFLK